ncbi:pyruvate dehydrogenase (acetyl-transferring) E1 component subunit alpha [Deinococcus rubellus]|uniref:pyruvate dehydrogenase (acetyl-transferring) E1 component subunit alpha n=1 Tax=Deinococcus rubellus TaxID=1889240 RepID=UPI0031E51A85
MTAATLLPDPRLEGTLSVLAPDGSLLRPDLVPDDETILNLYKSMRRARVFDDRAMVLQRQGKLGVYPCFGGMEATQVGAATALQDGDWVLPTYRGTALAMVRGMSLAHILLAWRGHPAGYQVDPKLHILPFYIPIANQIPHTAGIALAEKRRGTGLVAMAFIGDGGTSEGDFHVGVNFAGAFGAPAIFVIENNGWAISTPTSVQTAAKNLASRAEGYGMPGVRVDGNDVLAMYHVTREAAERARRGEGPTLIEAITYRILPHTSSDDPGRYREETEAQAWKSGRDPGKRLRAYLEGRGLWSEDQEQQVMQEMEAEIKAAMLLADQAPEILPEALLEHIYAEPLPEMLEQLEEIRALGALE